MLPVDQILRAAAIVARTGSIPFREPSSARPPFWAQPINTTKTRPIPAHTDWFDYVALSGGAEFFPEGYSAMVSHFIGTSKNDMVTSGIEYRFMLNGAFLPSQEIGLTAGVELGVDRLSTTPWPAMHRKISITVTNMSYLALQVRNTSGATQIAIAGLFGWYYPNLNNGGREVFEADLPRTIASPIRRDRRSNDPVRHLLRRPRRKYARMGDRVRSRTPRAASEARSTWLIPLARRSRS